MTIFWIYALLVAGVYCLLRALLDFKARRYLWGVAGLASAALLFSIPIPTHAIKIDLPAPQK